MGNQGHCGEGIRRTSESLQQGILGSVREVPVKTDTIQ